MFCLFRFQGLFRLFLVVAVVCCVGLFFVACGYFSLVFMFLLVGVVFGLCVLRLLCIGVVVFLLVGVGRVCRIGLVLFGLVGLLFLLCRGRSSVGVCWGGLGLVVVGRWLVGW